MAKAKSITTLIEELQTENEHLQKLGKLFNKACLDEFGYGVKDLHKIIEKWHSLERQKGTKLGSEFQASQRED